MTHFTAASCDISQHRVTTHWQQTHWQTQS